MADSKTKQLIRDHFRQAFNALIASDPVGGLPFAIQIVAEEQYAKRERENEEAFTLREKRYETLRNAG